MQKPSRKNQNPIRGLEQRTPRDSGSVSVPLDVPMANQGKSTRKSSSEINKTANAFVQQGNNLVVNRLTRNEGHERKPDSSAKPQLNCPVGKTTVKQIVETQGSYIKSRTPATPVQTKMKSGKTAASSLDKGANPSGMSWKSDRRPTTDSPAMKSSMKKTAHIKANNKDVKMGGGRAAKGIRADCDVSRPNHGASSNYSSDATSNAPNQASKSTNSKITAQKSHQAPGILSQSQVRAGANERNTKNEGSIRRLSARKLDYYTTSSSDDECTRPPKGPNAPLSPVSKAKMWHDINKSPGPTYPGWKFRSPPEGRHLSQIGAEELSAMFKNMKLEAQAKTEEVAPKGPSKFSDYMRKMKTASRVEDMSEASLQQNIELKKMYAEQLDAMEKRAWDSLQALDANLKRNTESGSRASFDKLVEGTSRIPNQMTVGDLVKSRGGNFEGKADTSKKPLKRSFARGEVVQTDEFSSDESGMMSPQRSGQPSPRGNRTAKETTRSNPAARMEQMLADIRSTRRNLAKGDGLQDPDAVNNPDKDFKTSNASPRPPGFGDSPRSGPNAKTRPTPDDTRSLSRVTADQFKSLADEDPLKKLKKISEKLKLDNASMLSRRAPHTQAIMFSSSEDEESNDFDDVPCKY